ncbi:hypothetical protein NDU88_004079 [Pleurodeles waltl]|uniref:Uncharacterized protein n=1 Tax=Pleurodeles waltl TaxID=8319 RepID=A0AAV7RER0_PLEWA|nr:hypothetical protein NDU88_004079 [Pleurodeles waltl]
MKTYGDPSMYRDYYRNQAGYGALPMYFQEAPVMYGAGLGSFFRSLFRRAMPFLRRGYEMAKTHVKAAAQDVFFHGGITASRFTPLAPIEVYVSGSTDMYLDLNNTLLHLICKIVKADGSDIANDAEVATIAYPVATMFNQVDINLGDRLITQSDNIYAYRAYIQSVLKYSSDALDTQLSAGLFYKDTYGHFEATALDVCSQVFVKRESFAAGSRQFDLLGRIHSDLLYQDKLLVNGINLKIKLIRNKDSFCLISGDAEQYKLITLSASLFVK